MPARQNAGSPASRLTILATVTGSLVFTTGNFVITSSLPIDASERPSIEYESVTKYDIPLRGRFRKRYRLLISQADFNAPSITRSPHDWPSSAINHVPFTSPFPFRPTTWRMTIDDLPRGFSSTTKCGGLRAGAARVPEGSVGAVLHALLFHPF